MKPFPIPLPTLPPADADEATWDIYIIHARFAFLVDPIALTDCDWFMRHPDRFHRVRPPGRGEMCSFLEEGRPAPNFAPYVVVRRHKAGFSRRPVWLGETRAGDEIWCRETYEAAERRGGPDLGIDLSEIQRGAGL
ncbi:MAG: hypothetical protein ACOY3L_14365 [Pseudomonadota bacterium]